MTPPTVRYPLENNTPTSHLPFSPSVVVGNMVFVSGQASVDGSGNIVSDSFEGEFRRSMENLNAVLNGAGCNLSHVVQTRNYVRDDKDLAAFNELYKDYFFRTVSGPNHHYPLPPGFAPIRSRMRCCDPDRR